MENVDYVIDGDGTWRMTAAAQNNTYFSGDVLISSGPAVPGLASEAFQRRYYDTTVNFISDQLGIRTRCGAGAFMHSAAACGRV